MEFESPRSIPPPALSSQFAQALLDSLPLEAAVLDADGHIMQVNRAWTAAMQAGGGRPERCGVGADYLAASEAATGQDAPGGMSAAHGLRRVLRGQQEEYTQTYSCVVAGVRQWFFLRARAVQDGPQTYALVTHENVSEQWLAREHLDEEVQQAVARRTSALSEANRDLEAFAASVSHDLRAPVRHIQGFLRALRQRLRGRGDEGDDTLLDTLEGSAARLGIMIDELLSLARLGKQPMKREALALTQVFERAWRQLAPERVGREVEWVLRPLPEVQGDARLLEYAAVNLLSNALKYTAQGHHTRIEVTARDGEDRHVISIQDDGVGFDARFVDRLFTPFQRLHSGRDYQGVGMGLANVKRIIERHGGTVWADGHPGDGATFYFSLPKETPGTEG